jgi:hypothetical protein
VVEAERLGDGDELNVVRGAACLSGRFGNPPPDLGEAIRDVGRERQTTS